MALTFSYVVPVHNEAPTLEHNVRRMEEELAKYPGSRILLVENGSRDDSWEVCKRLAGERNNVTIEAYQEANAGLGYALHRGVLEEIPRPEDDRWLLLTAADLPFGFTDVEGFLEVYRTGARPDIVVGSKANPRSKTRTDWQRKTVTRIYRLLRRVVANMKTGDSQGTFFFRASTVKDIVPQIQSRDFFWTTELVFLAERARLSIVEVPIQVEEEQRASTVRPFKHGSKMLAQLVTLRAKELGIKL